MRLAHLFGALVLIGACGARADEPRRVDPEKFKLEIVSPDGEWKMRFGLTAQIWTQVNDRGPLDADPDDRETHWIVDFRRVRPTLSGTAFTHRFGYLLHLSVLPGSWEFMDLMGDYAFTPGLHLRFGQWKVPYTRHRIRSYKNRQVVDWSSVSKYFGAERQIGVCLHNGYDASMPPPFEWAVGVFTGVNARTAHAVGPSLLYTWEDGDPVGRPIHPEIVGRVAYNHGGIDTTGEADLEGGAPRFALSVSGAWDLRPEFAQDWAVRGAADALFKAGGFSAAATFYIATAQVDESLTSQRMGAVGAWAGVGYVIAKRVQIVAEYALVDPVGVDGTVHEPRGGVAVFILGRRIQWRTDGGVVLYPDREESDIQVRSIIQMSL